MAATNTRTSVSKQSSADVVPSEFSTDTAFQDPPAWERQDPAATLKPQVTGRRSRSDSPQSEGEQPLKRQQSLSMEHREATLASEEPAREASSAAREGGAPSAAGEGRCSPPAQRGYGHSETFPPASARHNQLGSQRRHGSSPAAAFSATYAAAAHLCPPYGSKSVIGRRAKMEDAFTAVPYLMEVQVCDSLDEVVPPRIAPQIHNPSPCDQHPADSSGAASSATHEGGAGASSSGRQLPCHRGQQLDPASLVMPVGGPDGATETLHFFGVFDGHGGADAALHCAQTMHERVREALSSLTSAAAPAPSSSSQQHGGGAGATSGAAARPASAATSEYVDAGSGELASTSSASSFLECDLEPGGEGEGGGSRMEGAPCTTETVENALTKAFHLTDEEFGNMGGYEHLALVGTTAVVAMVGTRMIYVANCGDSRAVLCRDGLAVPLTDDHKAAREDETARVEAAGGQILFWNGVRVMGLLAVSRAIGDHSLRPYVIAKPEVTIVSRHHADELLVMASDGLWDVMNNQEACTLAKKCLLRARQRGSSRQSAARVAATVLTRAAVDRGSRDNVTVVIVDLSPATEEELAAAEKGSSERTDCMAPSDEPQRAASARPAPQEHSESTAPEQVQADSAQQAAAAPSPFALSAGLQTSGPDPAGAGPDRAAMASGGEAQQGGLVSPFSSGMLPPGVQFEGSGQPKRQ